MVQPGEAAGKTPSSPAAQPMAVGENIRTLAASKRKKVNETSLNFSSKMEDKESEHSLSIQPSEHKEMHKKFGSIEDYFANGLDIGESGQQALCGRFLE